MKTSRMMFYSDYVSDEQLILALENSSVLDKCYVGVSDIAWSGRKMEGINTNLLKNIKDITPNAEVIWIDSGMYSSQSASEAEATCRNAIINKSIDEKFDFLVVQDTDEFVHEDDWNFLLNDYFPTMVSVGYDTCAIRWKNFWKSWNHLLLTGVDVVPGWPGEWATFGLNLSKPVFFSSMRHTESVVKCGIKQDVFLYHGPWILTDEQVRRKISSWGHSQDMNYENWYVEKWLNWNENTTDLHPSKIPHVWKKAIPYNGKLPKECK
jgi:hypothetical protein